MTEISLILTGSSLGVPAIVVALADQGTGVASIPPAALKALRDGRDQIIRMMNGAPRMSSDDLRRFGQEMGKALFSDDVGATWATASGATAPIITKILATSPELKAIPWEYAAWPSGQDGPQRSASVVRLVPQSRVQSLEPIPKGDLRVLILSANPLNLNVIPWNDVRDGLIRVFQAALPTVEFVADDQKPTTTSYVRIVEAATRKSVESWIGEDDPHIVHFVGHGTDRGLALINSKKNDATLMTAAAFQAALVQAASCRLVILSACDTANHSSVDPVDATIGTFAEQLVRNAVAAVVASQTVIDKRTVATFCEGLYLELLRSGSIDVAVAAGRCSVASELDKVDSAAIEWGIPVLYRRLGASQLFA